MLVVNTLAGTKTTLLVPFAPDITFCSRMAGQSHLSAATARGVKWVQLLTPITAHWPPTVKLIVWHSILVMVFGCVGILDALYGRGYDHRTSVWQK